MDRGRAWWRVEEGQLAKISANSDPITSRWRGTVALAQPTASHYESSGPIAGDCVRRPVCGPAGGVWRRWRRWRRRWWWRRCDHSDNIRRSDHDDHDRHDNHNNCNNDNNYDAVVAQQEPSSTRLEDRSARLGTTTVAQRQRSRSTNGGVGSSRPGPPAGRAAATAALTRPRGSWSGAAAQRGSYTPMSATTA
jgi:hypothetical protein